MHRLVYKSKSEKTLSKETLRDILYTSLEKNRAVGVTGVLIATHSHFLQYLEGEFDDVNETFFRIVKDPRHTGIKLVGFGAAEKALFSQWRMKAIGLFDLNMELENQLKQVYGEEEGGVFLPVEEPKALSMLRVMGLIE